jgi:hypothetical protein
VPRILLGCQSWLRGVGLCFGGTGEYIRGPQEVRVFADVALRTVWLGGKKDMSAKDQLNLVTRHWAVIERKRVELGSGPWSVTLLGNGLSPRVWRPS